MAVRQDLAAVRQRMRAARRALCAEERAAAATAIAANLARLGLPIPGTRVGAYMPMDGELDPCPALEMARERGCRLFVPVITRFSRPTMRFSPLGDHARMHRNRWGISEPDQPGIHGRWLDLALVPCVAFDATGARLGMGAGFYDRHFSFLMSRSAWRRPRLLGLAYDFQRMPQLDVRSWDVPLWGVVTECGVYGRAAELIRPTTTETAG
jgi:5-formyltetrahydrofolate cyclo-ligase